MKVTLLGGSAAQKCDLHLNQATITDDKQLYGGSRLKQAGFVARGATEIIGLGILWGIADAVSSLFRALSGKKTDVINQPTDVINQPTDVINQPDGIKTENSGLSEIQRQKNDFIINKIRQIMADGFVVLNGTKYQVTPNNFRAMVPYFFWSIADDDSQHLFTLQELDGIKNFFISSYQRIDELFAHSDDGRLKMNTAVAFFERGLPSFLEE